MSLCGEVSALCTAQSTFLAHCCGAGRMHAHAARGTRCARLARRAVAGGPERAETDVRVSLSLSSPRRRGRAGQGSQGGLGHVPVKPAQFECESRSVTALAALRLAPAHRDCQWQYGPGRHGGGVVRRHSGGAARGRDTGSCHWHPRSAANTEQLRRLTEVAAATDSQAGPGLSPAAGPGGPPRHWHFVAGRDTGALCGKARSRAGWTHRGLVVPGRAARSAAT